MIENTTPPLGSIKCFEATIFDDAVVVFPERRRRRRRRRRSNKPKELFEGGVENFSRSRRVGREREELFKKLLQ